MIDVQRLVTAFTRFGFNDDVIESTAFEDSAVSVVHGLVRDVEGFFVGVEAVCVFHNKFA